MVRAREASADLSIFRYRLLPGNRRRWPRRAAGNLLLVNLAAGTRTCAFAGGLMAPDGMESRMQAERFMRYLPLLSGYGPEHLVGVEILLSRATSL